MQTISASTTCRKLRVAFIGFKGYPYVYSGYETLLGKLVPLLRREFELHIYCHRSLFEDRPAILEGVHLHYVPAIEKKYLSHLSHGLSSTVHALFFRYDVLFFVNSANGVFGILSRLLGRYSLLHLDGIEWRRREMPGAAKLFYFASARIGARAFSKLIADSRILSRYYRAVLGREPLNITYGAARPGNPDSKHLERLGLEDDGYYLVVARLVRSNNIDFLIDEYVASGARKPLIIAGDFAFPDPYVAALHRRASERVRFLGRVVDQDVLATLYTHCSAYVHGHSCGGINPGLLAALACGCLVIAVDSPFTREVLSPGDIGVRFPLRQGSLSKILSHAEAAPERYSGYRKRAVEMIGRRFDWTTVAEQYAALFRQCRRSRGE